MMMNLNPDQGLVVSHEKGPLLVIAGAGTGKTRAITSKIVDLISLGKAKPSEVLALTFTDKAAWEMSSRIDDSIGVSYEEICVKTFHSFSEQVLREAGLEIGIDPGFSVLDKVKQWFFFKKNLFSFDLNYYRPLGNPNRFIYDLLEHFSKLKDELIDPDSYIDYSKKITDEEGVKMLEIALAYKKYQELKVKNNYLDFGDLVYLCIQLLKTRSSVLKKYQARYKYIFVDEFQDTNYAQFQLVMLLAEAHKNIIVVGDDDQSIYKWRGASLSNILHFEEAFPEAKKVVLSENYRSSEDILESAYSVIQNNNPDRLEIKSGVNKRLKCNASFNYPVQVHHFPSFVQENEFIAEQIKKLHFDEGIPFGEIAVLMRTNQAALNFVDELKYLGIPYQIRNPRGLLGFDEIKDLVSVIRFLSNPRDDIAILRILKMDVFDIPMNAILELLNKEKKNYLFENLRQEVSSDNLEIPGIETGLKTVYSLLFDLVEFSKKNPVGIVINEFFTRTGYLKYLIDKEKFPEIENINEFAKHVSRFERENKESFVIDFSGYLDLLSESNATLSAETFADADSVQVLTVHGSKGLEFDCVFIVGVVNYRFPKSRMPDPFTIPDELTKEIYPEGDFHLQEERRLFYVAMTRARKKLFVTYSTKYEGNRNWKVSPFVTEVIDSGKAVLTDHPETEDAVKKLKEFKVSRPPILKLPPFKSTKLSYSQLDTFKTCPLKYSYHYMLKIPEYSSHAGNFGNSVHKTLNDFYKVLTRGEAVSLELLKDLYEKNWIPYGYESKKHEDVRKSVGLEMLTKYYQANCSSWVVPKYLERSFNLKIGDYWINGRIDRIDELKDGTFEVVDYKTGRAPKNPDIDRDLQLSIYALACRDVFKIPVSLLSLYYLEGNEKLTTTREDKKLLKVATNIGELIDEMKSSEFKPTPGIFNCQFCDYKLVCPAA